MGTFTRHLRFSGRQLRQRPGFTLTVVVTLALAIGANTAIFSVVNALLLKRLPYSHPERMGTIFTRVTGARPSDERHNLDGRQWQLLRDNVPSLISAISSGRTSGVNLKAGTQVRYVLASRISAHYLEVLDMRPVIGRDFSDAEDLPHGPKVAILSDGLWRSAFASNPEILKQDILLKGEPYAVVGVLAEGATTPANAEIYTPIQAGLEGEGSGTNFSAITRLREGATWEQADAEINHAWSLRSQPYELNDNPGAKVRYYSVPLQKGMSAKVRPQALTLMVAAGLILFIACANLAGLTLVRLLQRKPEIATRLAFGATRWQIQEQLWAENLLLAVLGGATGVGVGFAALRGLLLLLPKFYLPVSGVDLDGRVLAFTSLLSLLTSVLFGMLPALATREFDVRSAISSRAAAGGERLRLRQALIVSEVALTAVLLAGSGLLIRTLIHLQRLPPGFNPTGVTTAKASLDDVRFHDPANFRKLLDQSAVAMRQIPGVQHAAVGLSLPYERSLNDGVVLSDGPDSGARYMTGEVYITPEYFSALQIPVLAGRSFTDSDGPGTQHVAIVNRTFARKFYHGEDPVGHFINQDTRIVGVVEDVAVSPGLDIDAPLSDEQGLYIPASQMPSQALALVHVWFQPNWIVRTAGSIEGITADMQRAMASVDPNLPFSGFSSMRDLLAETLATQRVEVALLSTMAGLALLLSAVGIFGLVANIVTQKTREIGIRMALGSSSRQAMLKIGGPGVRASLLGLALGLILCSGVLRFLNSVLYGVGAYDGATILSVVLTLALVTAAAATVPALRVARIDPAQTLRDE